MHVSCRPPRVVCLTIDPKIIFVLQTFTLGLVFEHWSTCQVNCGYFRSSDLHLHKHLLHTLINTLHLVKKMDIPH